MNNAWKNIVIKDISVAVYVAPDMKKHIHKNRTYHGFVINTPDSVKDYYFDNGRVLHTEGNSLFYLPKGSSYYVNIIRQGGCYAINFDAEIEDNEFSISLKNTEKIIHNFKAACNSWINQNDYTNALCMRALYDAIYRVQKESAKEYISKKTVALLDPALKALESSFTQNSLRVSYLASLCGVSEVYFRKLFLNTFGMTPKEYIIQKRVEYAKSLLRVGEFTISEIASMCGYIDVCHFSREFSKHVGMSPGQYQTLCKP